MNEEFALPLMQGEIAQSEPTYKFEYPILIFIKLRAGILYRGITYQANLSRGRPVIFQMYVTNTCTVKCVHVTYIYTYRIEAPC